MVFFVAGNCYSGRVMTREEALHLKTGNKIMIKAPHYTGKMRLTEPPTIFNTYADTIWLFGIGEEGQLLGCAHTYASHSGKMKKSP